MPGNEFNTLKGLIKEMSRLEISLEVVIEDFQKDNFGDEDETAEVVRLTLERELDGNVSVSTRDYYLIEDEEDYTDEQSEL